MANQAKREHYKDLIDRMNKAHNDEYYLEASWFAYTVLEDRLLSALRQSGGATYANFRPIRMLGKKMQEITQRKRSDSLLSAYFDDPLMDRIHKW
jgi:hypothetical protein